MSSMVGAPWITNQQRVQRAETSPLDKCTVVSIYPKPILETKPTLEPGKFRIPKGSYENPGLLVVGSSSYWRVIDLDQPILEIPVSSIMIANSIVVDYCNGILGCDMDGAMPGLFFVPGALNVKEVQEKHKAKLDEMNQKQKNWYAVLVKMADTMWARTNGNPLSINEDARIAAEALGFKDKPWMKDFATLEFKNCPACGTLRNNDFPVCQHCKTVVDPDKFKALGLKFAS